VSTYLSAYFVTIAFFSRLMGIVREMGSLDIHCISCERTRIPHSLSDNMKGMTSSRAAQVYGS
jgi:hypothetical protein